jgi:integral membrane protein
VQAAVNRYRALAYVVGTLLIVLIFIAVPVRYIGGEPALSSVVSPVHGFLYMVYLVFAFDLYRRASWPLSRMVMMVAAGFVPFLAFFIERKITQEAKLLAAAESAA